MPYIEPHRRSRIWDGDPPQTEGELNFAITILVDQYLQMKGLRYEHLNAAIGALECAKLELYRRVAAPYENGKIEANGDVYTDHEQAKVNQADRDVARSVSDILKGVAAEFPDVQIMAGPLHRIEDDDTPSDRTPTKES